jgi:hypothetical protein
VKRVTTGVMHDEACELPPPGAKLPGERATTV